MIPSSAGVASIMNINNELRGCTGVKVLKIGMVRDIEDPADNINAGSPEVP